MTSRTPARRRGRERASAGVAVLLALTGALLLLAAALAGTASAGTTGAPPAGLRRAFLESDDIARRSDTPGKDALHRLQIVANLRAETPDSPLVLLLGGSAARESTVDDTAWATDIERAGGPPVTVYNLGCRHDTFAEDLEIARLLPADMPALVFIGINLGRFANPRKSPVVVLPEPLLPPPGYTQHIYSVSKRVQPRATKAYYLQYWLKARRPQFQARYGYNLTVLERVVEACLDRGLHPVLLDLPRDLDVIGHTLDGQVAQMKAGCAMIARAYGIPWVTPVKGANLVDADFFDLWHLVEPGRVKYQARVSAKTVELLHRYELDRPAEPVSGATPLATPTP